MLFSISGGRAAICQLKDKMEDAMWCCVMLLVKKCYSQSFVYRIPVGHGDNRMAHSQQPSTFKLNLARRAGSSFNRQ